MLKRVLVKNELNGWPAYELSPVIKKASYYRQTAEDVQAGKGVPSVKIYDPEAEPTRVVRTFTQEEFKKDLAQEKGRGMEYC